MSRAVDKSATALLPDDLLSEILCLACESSVDAKFAVSQVSARWRQVALSTPLLWTHFHICSNLDRYRIHLVLERTGPSAPLRVQITGLPYWTHRDYSDNALQALIPYAARIQTLESSATNGTAWSSNIVFATLEILRVRGGESGAPEVCVQAPNLRVVDLAFVRPLCLSDFLSERLEEIRIQICTNVAYAELLTVLTRCVNLVHLTFHTDETQADHVQRRWDIPPLRRLRTMDLQLPFGMLVEVLNNVTDSDTVLLSVTACFTWGRDALYMQDSYAALLRHMGPLVSFRVKEERYITLHDAHGLKRTMDIWHPNRMSTWEHVWVHLAQIYCVQDTIREIWMPLRLWNTLVDDLTQYPPHNLPTLRVLIEWEDLEHISKENGQSIGDLPTLSSLALPGLVRLEFGCLSGHGALELPAKLILHILRSIALDVNQSLDLALEAPIPQLKELRDLLEAEGDDRWHLVS